MKNWIAALFFAALSTTQAQDKVNEYKYIILPQNLSGFENNQFKLKNRLNQLLKDKNYTTVSYIQANWPEDLKNNPCLGATVDARKKRALTTNNLIVDFKNCHNLVIGEFEGKSHIKEFEEGFQEALKLAINTLPISTPKEINHTQNLTPTETIAPVTTSAVISEQTTLNPSQSNIWTDGQMKLQKVDLQHGGFMLMNDNGDHVVAKFEPSLRPGVYRVNITEGNYSTIGYFAGNEISYEILQSNTWKEVKLKTK